MMWFITRRRHEAETARLRTQIFNAEVERVRLQHRLTDEATANARLADRNDDLQRRLDGDSEAREQDDIRRKALAEALGVGQYRGWDLLVTDAVALHQAAEEAAAAHAAERQRADELAVGLLEASPEEIRAWEARVKAHLAWRPVEGTSGRPTHPATDLRRALERCRALQALLDGRGKRVAS